MPVGSGALARTPDQCHTIIVSAELGARRLKCPQGLITDHPLLFTFRDVVSGDGFLAAVTLSGRILMTQEDDKWWVYGVRPAAIAESGNFPPETFLRFRNRYREILFDIAEEQRSFESFRQEVERFFHERDFEEERKWEGALARIRSENQETPALFAGLPRWVPETQPALITVERLDEARKRFMPSDNVLDTYAAVAT